MVYERSWSDAGRVALVTGVSGGTILGAGGVAEGFRGDLAALDATHTQWEGLTSRPPAIVVRLKSWNRADK